MFAKVIAQSVPDISGVEFSHEYQRNAEDIAGLCANVCYSNGYEPESIDKRLNDYETNIDRFNRVSGTGHHSIADHASISVYLGEISKITAMLLNSLEYYTTSERSARYTNIAKKATPSEAKMYEKWMDILVPKIASMCPELSSVRVDKLAKENARYFIDVCGPYTSMVYTTTYRQWSYIAEWADEFIAYIRAKGFATGFESTLVKELEFIRDFIYSDSIGNTGKIQNFKDRGFDFLTYQMGSYFPSVEQIGDMYSLNYMCSFSCLGQAQRHRTLKYVMRFVDDKTDNYFFYVPKIVEDRSDEWCSDMASLVSEGYYPQGIMVYVNERGSLQDFILKCKERLCGRAQLEIAQLTADTLGRLYFGLDDSHPMVDTLEHMYNPGERVKAKCELLGTCQEPCEFKAVHAIDRMI